ncbi:hypothetical protein UY9_11007 [Bacillus atrophaeus C89]|nr:hypothetical protein UY9_11007 [Bacillus atrophaeus C89]
MLYYQKIKKKEESFMNAVTQSASKTCSLCSGKGYIQLLLGGSETCPSCGGTGKADRSFSSR